MKAKILFKSLQQDSQDYAAFERDDAHVVSVIHFDKQVGDQQFRDLSVEVRQPYGTDFESEPLEVSKISAPTMDLGITRDSLVSASAIIGVLSARQAEAFALAAAATSACATTRLVCRRRQSWTFLMSQAALGDVPRPNHAMKPTAPLRNKFSVFATTPRRGLSASW